MANIRLFVKFFDFFFASVWGLTIMDLLKISGENPLESIDGWIKTLMAICGLIYFIFKIISYIFIEIPHKNKIQKLELQLKEEELEKITRENDKQDRE